MSKAVLVLENVHKHFRQGGKDLHILKGVSLVVEAGETVALVGPSGCGKSTLLQIAGLLDTYDEGRVLLGDREAGGLSDNARTALRRDKMGFVYQHHHLLPECSALENVMLPPMMQRKPRTVAKTRALELLAQLGLEDRAEHRPGELSGGQMQRVAIARALANRPAIVLADEPTGNLDPETAARVMDVMMKAIKDAGAALLMVTHDRVLAAKMDRTVTLVEGKIAEMAG